MIFLLGTLNISRKKTLLCSILFPLKNLCFTKLVKIFQDVITLKEREENFPNIWSTEQFAICSTLRDRMYWACQGQNNHIIAPIPPHGRFAYNKNTQMENNAVEHILFPK